MSRVGNLKVIGYEFKGLCKMGVAQAPGSAVGTARKQYIL